MFKSKINYDKAIRKVLDNNKLFDFMRDTSQKPNNLETNIEKLINDSKHDPKKIEKIYNIYQQYANDITNPKFKYVNYNYKSKYNLEKALEVLDELVQGRSPTKYSDFIDYDFDVVGKKIPTSQFNTGSNPSESFKKVFEDATGKNYDEYIKNKNTPRDTRFDVHRGEDQYTKRSYYEPNIPQSELDNFIDETFFKDRPDLQLNNNDPLDFIDNIGTELDPETKSFNIDKNELINALKDKIDISNLDDKSIWNALHPFDNYLRRLKRQYDIKNDLEAYGKSDLEELLDNLFQN